MQYKSSERYVILNVQPLFILLFSIIGIEKITKFLTFEEIIVVFLNSDHEEDPVQLLYSALCKKYCNFEYSEYTSLFVEIATSLESELMDLYPENNNVTSFSYQMCEYRFFQWTGKYTLMLEKTS